jgi:hypothetical protein
MQQQQLRDEYVLGEWTGSQRQKQKRNGEERAKCTRYVFEVLEMKRSKPTTEFWTVLAMVNLLGLLYPIHLLAHANGIDENLFATCVLVGSLFLLMVVDAVSIVVADALGTVKRWAGQGFRQLTTIFPLSHSATNGSTWRTCRRKSDIATLCTYLLAIWSGQTKRNLDEGR